MVRRRNVGIEKFFEKKFSRDQERNNLKNPSSQIQSIPACKIILTKISLSSIQPVASIDILC